MIRATTTSKKKAGAGCLIPFGFFFLAIGLAICWFAWTKILVKAAEVRKWTPTPCQVTQWEPGIETTGADVYKPVLRLAYTYTHQGQSHTGTVYDAAEGTVPGLNELEEEGVAARSGASTCLVNPANPAQSSFIRPGYTAGAVVLGFGILFGSVGGVIALAGVAAVIARLLGRSTSTGTGAQAGCLGAFFKPVFFAVFALAGFLVWKLGIAGQPEWKTIAPRMVEVPAKILASGVSKSTSSGKNSKTTYKARVAWEYQFDGRSWHSGWVDFNRGTTSGSNHGKAQETAGRYPAGSSARAWVDPQAPWQAVLEKSGGTGWWLWLFPIIFGGIGFIGLGWWLLRLVILGTTLATARRN